jgi:hypothetical protein
MAAGCGASAGPAPSSSSSSSAAADSNPCDGPSASQIGDCQPGGGAHPNPSPDVTLSCAAYNDPVFGPVPRVTMTTSNLVNTGSIDVTVIEFDKSGDQLGTAVVSFDGPFAPDQTFRQEGSDSPQISYCEIADVSTSDGYDLTYRNDNPVD